MRSIIVMFKYKHKKSRLLNPVSDDQQSSINDLVDMSNNCKMNLDPTDPRAIPYLRPALWLWK